MRRIQILLMTGAIVFLILHASEAAEAVQAGVTMVLYTIVPSLFLLLVLSAWMTSRLSGIQIPWMSKLLGIPQGMEGIFILGCIGGYPIGAQIIAQCYKQGQLSKEAGERMLGFCTNCGPAFIFGILATKFQHPHWALVLYLLCILSAIITAQIVPDNNSTSAKPYTIAPVSFPQAVQAGIRSIVSISAWIILSKTLLHFLNQFLLFRFPKQISITATGFMELTNGCICLEQLEEQSLRFLLACLFSAFGGCCVWMQVVSICAPVGLSAKKYLPHKLLQGMIILILACLYLWMPGIYLLIVPAVFLRSAKKAVEISSPMVYNGGN